MRQFTRNTIMVTMIVLLGLALLALMLWSFAAGTAGLKIPW